MYVCLSLLALKSLSVLGTSVTFSALTLVINTKVMMLYIKPVYSAFRHLLSFKTKTIILASYFTGLVLKQSLTHFINPLKSRIFASTSVLE